MVIRPLIVKRRTEDLKDYYKLSEKAKNTKIQKPNTFIRLNKIFMTTVLVCSLWIVTYKSIFKKYFFKNSSNEEIKDYTVLELENSKKESDWMTKLVYTNEYNSNK